MSNRANGASEFKYYGEQHLKNFPEKFLDK